MPKPTNKAIIITVAATLLGGALGSGATYLVMDKQNSRDLAIRNAGPENADFTDISDTKQGPPLPQGTVSPSSVVLEPHKYADKQIKVRGQVIGSGQDQYAIIGQEADKPVGLRLDFSKSNVDPKPYAATAPGTKVESDKAPAIEPVTVTGTLQKSEANGILTYTFFVQSIDK